MKILLLGHKGCLGSFIHRHLKTDILTKRDIYNNGNEYDYVINCIGKPDVEYCENNVSETDYSNWFILEDIKQCYPNAKIINFSSYYVYDDEGLCNEVARTTNVYAYMRQKLNAEIANKKGLTLRLGKLFNKNKLIGYILKNDELILDSILFNPVSPSQVLNVINYELKNNCLTGIYNLANAGIASAYDLGIYANQLLNTDKKIIKIERINRIFHNYGRCLMDVSAMNKICTLIDWHIDFKNYISC